MTPAIRFACTLAVLYALHALADHWIQTNRQASAKGGLGWPARLAALRHVITYTTTVAVGLALVDWRCQLVYDVPRVALALLFNAATHYVADRREPLIWLATNLGKGGWLRSDPEAAYKLESVLAPDLPARHGADRWLTKAPCAVPLSSSTSLARGRACLRV